MEYSQADATFRKAVIAGYNRAQQAQANLRAQESHYNLSQTELATADLKHQLGLISDQELAARRLETQIGETNYHQARFGYNMAVTDYHLVLEGIVVGR